MNKEVGRGNFPSAFLLLPWRDWGMAARAGVSRVLILPKLDASVSSLKVLCGLFRKLFGRPAPKPVERILSRWIP